MLLVIHNVLRKSLFPLILAKRLVWNRFTRFIIRWIRKGLVKILRFLNIQIEALLVILDFGYLRMRMYG